MAYTDRIIVLVDADCFYCQVEEKLDPSLEGKPIAVVQFNAWRDGGIIAVNYAARNKGCTKGIWMNEAKQKCPEIRFVRVTNVRGRADLTKYRDASKKIADVLQTFTQNIERASIDESYIDVTDLVIDRLKNDENSFQRLTVDVVPDTHVVGCGTADFLSNLDENDEFTENNCRLAIGSLIAQEMRVAILQKTGYKCSAGIAHNKILAKLACGFHKPNQQTILPSEAVSDLFKTLPLMKIKRLGGKFGASVAENLQVENVGDLLQFSEKELSKKFDEKTAKWLYNISRGIDREPVTSRIISKSISCCKRFPFKYVLTALGSVEHWLKELAFEVNARLEQELEENNRRATQITVSFGQEIDKKTASVSKTFPITTYRHEKFFYDAFQIVKKNLVTKSDGSIIVNFLGMSAANFRENKKNNLVDFFKNIKNNSLVKSEEVQSEKVEISNEINRSNAIDIDEASTSTEILFNSRDEIVGYSPKEKDVLLENIACDNNNINFVVDEFDDAIDKEAQSNAQTSQKLPIATESELESRDIIAQRVEGNFDKDLKDESLRSEGEYLQSNFVLKADGTSNQHINTNSADNVSTLNNQYAKSFFLNHLSDISKENEDQASRNYLFEKLREKAFVGSLEESNRAIQESVEASEICLECRKTIRISEMVAHMDHHFATKLANEEQTSLKSNAIMSKKQNVNSITNRKRLKNSSTGRKKGISKHLSKESLDNRPITSFLGKFEDLNDLNSEFCGECHKRVRYEDIESHSGYHTAKKLHSEINPYLNNQLEVLVTGANKIRGRTTRDISSFFKKT